MWGLLGAVGVVGTESEVRSSDLIVEVIAGGLLLVLPLAKVTSRFFLAALYSSSMLTSSSEGKPLTPALSAPSRQKPAQPRQNPKSTERDSTLFPEPSSNPSLTAPRQEKG